MSYFIPFLGISIYWGEPHLPTLIETRTAQIRTKQSEIDRFTHWPIHKIYGVGNNHYLLGLIRVSASKQIDRSIPRAQEPSA